jgi:hypothetical protein
MLLLSSGWDKLRLTATIPYAARCHKFIFHWSYTYDSVTWQIKGSPIFTTVKVRVLKTFGDGLKISELEQGV